MPVIQRDHLSSRTEDLLLSRNALQNYDHECADIYLFTQREVSLIYSCLRYADWEARWIDRDKDAPLVDQVKAKLLMLCVQDLVKAQIATVCALTGRTIDLGDDNAIQNFLTSNLDFSEDGVTPAIDRISGATEQDYTDELESIATVLGFLAV